MAVATWNIDDNIPNADIAEALGMRTWLKICELSSLSLRFLIWLEFFDKPIVFILWHLCETLFSVKK